MRPTFFPARRPANVVRGSIALLVTATITMLVGVEGPGRSLLVARPTWVVAFTSIVAGFAITEAMVFHVEFRRQTISFSIAEVPLGFALVFLGPVYIVLARLIGSSIGMLRRRPPLTKGVFNLGLFATEAAMASLLLRTVLAIDASSTTAKILLGVGAANVAASVFGTFAVTLVVAAHEGELIGRLRAEARSLLTVAIVGPAAAVVSLGASLISPGLVAIPVSLLVGLWAILRSNATLGQRFRDLSELHTFTSRTGRSLILDEIAHTAVNEISRLIRAELVTLVLTGTDSSPGRTFGSDLLVPIAAGHTTDHRGEIREFIPIEISDDDGPLGTLIVANREGLTATFSTDDLDRLESLAEQLAVSLRKARLHEQLDHEATHDRLTGLPNRARFERLAGELIGQSPTTAAAVLMIDLDRFKEVNDTLGHRVGDRLLIEVGRRLQANAEAGDVVSRLAGDEFAVGAARLDSSSLEALANQLATALKQPVDLGELNVIVTASVGLAIRDNADQDVQLLLRRADIAMRDAKRSHLAWETYRPEIDRSNDDRLALVGDLRTAIELDQLELHYQPKLALEHGTVTGVEALLRWNHPERGFIAPDVFIPLAEQTGLIHPLTDLVLRHGARAAASWRDAGLDLVVAMNLSTLNLLDDTLVGRISQQLAHHHLDARQLSFEVTESSFMTELDRSMVTLQRIDELGCALSVDDFGTGYSSLTYLRRLPVKEIKIDRSFVADLLLEDSDEVIVKATIDLGHNLGLSVVAEGVESEHVATRLRELGCDIAQGYGICRPLPKDKLDAWLTICPYQLRQRSGPNDVIPIDRTRRYRSA